MFKKNKTGYQPPEYRNFTLPPPPVSGSNAFKSGLVTILPNDIGTVEIMCHYETPCGWCTKWDKKCDKKIGCGDEKPQRGLRAKAGIFFDETSKPCAECAHDDWDMPQCHECDLSNNFKYFESLETTK